MVNFPFIYHFSSIFPWFSIYWPFIFIYFWNQLSQTIYWNHLLAILGTNGLKWPFLFIDSPFILKNGIETELPLPSSPFFFHFFSRPFSPLKWLFEEAWSTEIHYVLYTYWSIAIHIALRPKASIPWNYMYFLDHTMKEIKGTYNNKTTYKFRRK